jgi:hypothetical protein
MHEFAQVKSFKNGKIRDFSGISNFRGIGLEMLPRFGD